MRYGFSQKEFCNRYPTISLLVSLGLIFIVIGCDGGPPQALGNLEWDRINGRAVASEVISHVFVKEGDMVKTGTALLQLDSRKQKARVIQLEAQLEMAGWQLKELEVGPRQETISEAQARLEAAQSNLVTKSRMYERQKKLVVNNYSSQESLDIAKNEYLNAQAQVVERGENLKELLTGTRIEKIEQSKANVASLTAQLQRARLELQDYIITASRTGRVDSIPFKCGDRPPAQAVVSSLLTGDRPWARIYIPEPWRSKITPDKKYTIMIDGQEKTFSARLRSIKSEANFTPYYALTEKDRSRLVYVAEFELVDLEARNLTAGIPVQLLLEEK